MREILVHGTEIGSLPPDRALLTPRETAVALKVSDRTLAYWTAPGRKKPRISYVKFGKTKRFVVADVLRLIEEHKVKAKSIVEASQ